MPWLKLKLKAWIRLGRKLPSDKEFMKPENTRIATPIFWSRFFKIKYPSIWLWWLSEEVQAATRDSVYHKNCFSRGIIATRWFRRIKPLPFLQNKDYKPCCGVVACEGKSKYLCSTLSTEAEEFPGFQWRAIPGAFSLIPLVFSMRWGIFLEMRYCIWRTPGLYINTPQNQKTLWKMYFLHPWYSPFPFIPTLPTPRSFIALSQLGGSSALLLPSGSSWFIILNLLEKAAEARPSQTNSENKTIRAVGG